MLQVSAGDLRTQGAVSGDRRGSKNPLGTIPQAPRSQSTLPQKKQQFEVKLDSPVEGDLGYHGSQGLEVCYVINAKETSAHDHIIGSGRIVFVRLGKESIYVFHVFYLKSRFSVIFRPMTANAYLYRQSIPDT
jgi:hypothetical protein